MRAIFSTVAVLASTGAWLVLFFAVQPFHQARKILDWAFHAAPAWTHIDEMMVHDPLVQELSRGGAPLESFRILAGYWAGNPGTERIILMGNSQSLMATLAPGEAPPAGTEKGYTDIVTDRLRDGQHKRLFYRLSAGALSYDEMLWYALYLAGRPELKPDVLLLQLNYQNFMNSGIRSGMLELLSDPGFRARVEEVVRASGSVSFAQALQQFASADQTKGMAAQADVSPGDRIETAVRARLDHIPGFAARGTVYESSLDLLLRCRTYFLRIGSSTKRSLKGSRVDASRDALERTAQLCDASGIRLVLFQAPTNPSVPLYATPADDRDYHSFVNSLAARYGLTLFDFENIIPARYWGKTLNLPDPLHLGRTGHQLLGDRMISALEQNGM
jgi:hypothetical protein